MSTQTTAYSLIAMSKFIGSNRNTNSMRFSYNILGQKSIQKTSNLPVYLRTFSPTGGVESSDFKLTNQGKGMIYVRLIVDGIPVVGDQSRAESNLKLAVKYVDTEGNLLDPTKIKQGTDFEAQVTISNPGYRGYLKEMTLNQIFPSGWEIHNTRMDNYSSNTGYFDYQDIRDDRIYTYYGLSSGNSKTFKVKLNATYAGKYYLPTLMSEAMYDNSVNAREPGMWVEVVK